VSVSIGCRAGPAYYVAGPYGEYGPEADNSWAIHGLGAPGVRLSKAEIIALAKKILGRAR
jgi:hypothetical protein